MWNHCSISISFIILLTSTHLTLGLKCYRCAYFYSEGEQRECLYPKENDDSIQEERKMEENGTYRIPSQLTNTQSGTSRRLAREVCAAAFGTFDGEKAIARAKGDKKITAPSGCLVNIDQKLGNYRFIGDYCICDYDLCNGRNEPSSYGPSFNDPNSSSQGRLTTGILSTLLTAVTMIIFLE